MINNQQGIITADFMFAMVLILGFTALLFALSFSLTVASVTQYITFAAARNYVAAHVTPDMQTQRAQLKFQELVSNSVFKPLYQGNWFSISSPNIGDITKYVQGFKADGNVNLFWGVGTTFTAKILDFQIPFFGSTAPDSDGSGTSFHTYIGSYLGREITTDECLTWVAQRWNAIRNLSADGAAAYSTGTPANAYYPMTDNGC